MGLRLFLRLGFEGFALADGVNQKGQKSAEHRADDGHQGEDAPVHSLGHRRVHVGAATSGARQEFRRRERRVRLTSAGTREG